MIYHSADKIDELKYIDLWETYVLGWSLDGDELCIKLDTYLFPEHPKYTKPKPTEWACFVPAFLKFQGIDKLVGFDKLKADAPAIDASGEKDFGHVEEFKFTRLGEYKFIIEYAGEISFTAKSLKLELIPAVE